MKHRRPVVVGVVVVVALVVAAAVVVTRGFEWRTRVAITDAWLAPEGTLMLAVDTCGGDPVLDLLDENGEDVRVAVVSTRQMFRGRDDCKDSVEVPLERPLGDRTITDVTSGKTVELVP